MNYPEKVLQSSYQQVPSLTALSMEMIEKNQPLKVLHSITKMVLS